MGAWERRRTDIPPQREPSPPPPQIPYLTSESPVLPSYEQIQHCKSPLPEKDPSPAPELSGLPSYEQSQSQAARSLEIGEVKGEEALQYGPSNDSSAYSDAQQSGTSGKIVVVGGAKDQKDDREGLFNDERVAQHEHRDVKKES